MKRKLTILGVMACLLVVAFMFGCTISTSGYDNPNNPTNLKFKASNVVFRNTVKASDEFTDKKVYADDVVLNNANTSLTADNVQGAFEETQPKLSEIIVGEWDVKAYQDSDGDSIDQSKGSITFNSDGSFSFTGNAGQDFSSILMSQYGIDYGIKYIVYNDSLLGLTTDKGSKIRDFTSITTDKLIAKGKLVNAMDIVFVLTRHTEE